MIKSFTSSGNVECKFKLPMEESFIVARCMAAGIPLPNIVYESLIRGNEIHPAILTHALRGCPFHRYEICIAKEALRNGWSTFHWRVFRFGGIVACFIFQGLNVFLRPGLFDTLLKGEPPVEWRDGTDKQSRKLFYQLLVFRLLNENFPAVMGLIVDVIFCRLQNWIASLSVVATARKKWMKTSSSAAAPPLPGFIHAHFSREPCSKLAVIFRVA